MVSILLIYYVLLTHNFSLQFFNILFLIIPTILTFILIGMLIGYLSNNSQANIILSFLTIFIMLAFSGIMLPIELLSQKVISITTLNPYLISESILRKYLLFGNSISSLRFELIALSIYIFIFGMISIFFESIIKKRSIYQYFTSLQLAFHKKREKSRHKKKEVKTETDNEKN